MFMRWYTNFRTILDMDFCILFPQNLLLGQTGCFCGCIKPYEDLWATEKSTIHVHYTRNYTYYVSILSFLVNFVHSPVLGYILKWLIYNESLITIYFAKYIAYFIHSPSYKPKYQNCGPKFFPNWKSLGSITFCPQ